MGITGSGAGMNILVSMINGVLYKYGEAKFFCRVPVVKQLSNVQIITLSGVP